jgi:PhnB protein
MFAGKRRRSEQEIGAMSDAPTTETSVPAFEPPPPTAIGMTPYLTILDGRGDEALDFYTRAFGGRVVYRSLGQDGKRLMHARVEINGAMVFLSDDFPDFRGGVATPAPSAVTLHLQVDDADAWAARAAAAGAEITMPVDTAFWGDRYGHLKDPFGHEWSVGSTPKG